VGLCVGEVFAYSVCVCVWTGVGRRICLGVGGWVTVGVDMDRCGRKLNSKFAWKCWKAPSQF